MHCKNTNYEERPAAWPASPLLQTGGGGKPWKKTGRQDSGMPGQWVVHPACTSHF